MTIKLGNRLAELRKEHGYSQEELADKLGVSRQAVSKWECGEASPDTDNLIELAKLYNTSLDELLEIKKPEEKKDDENKHVVVDLTELVKIHGDRRHQFQRRCPAVFTISIAVTIGEFRINAAAIQAN